ncbi:hypothetical protein Mgra_00008793 [Meloidogyne graminicola]|uniref:Uncharacterized protein n=1 Tax=Meloidogyne graminicola TaxID=189291 RepID=A0A8S9ZEU0_9BILA|nr:hypothetical protein Mgra_00008793 [Meloidogyne graminicola]
MYFTQQLGLRRIFHGSYHQFRVIPKPSIWPKRERLKRFTAWQFGQCLNTVKKGSRTLNKIFIYMDMQRQDAPKLERHYNEERLKAALEEHNADYPVFKTMLSKAHILLDNRILVQLAIYEPKSFKSLVDLTQKMALDDGIQITTKSEDLEHVQTESCLFGQPFPDAKMYPRGPQERHINIPRKLKVEEY